MIGSLRFLLALAVVYSHLCAGAYVYSGGFAVFGFYTVSGFLIARVLTTTYRDNAPAFLANRCLRLYPSYFVAVLLGVIVASRGGTALNPELLMPDSPEGWARQVGIFGLLQVDGERFPARLVPPAWSLNIEIVWYLLMIVAVRYMAVWLALAGAVAAVAMFRNDWQLAYLTFFGPGLCFALGAAAYMYGITVAVWQTVPALILLAALPMVVWWMGYQVSALYYLGSAATAWFLAAAPRKREGIVGRWLGDLAYPLFLVHWSVASFVGDTKGWTLLLVALPFVLAVSALLVLFVERPIARLRNWVRPRRDALAEPSPPLSESIEVR